MSVRVISTSVEPAGTACSGTSQPNVKIAHSFATTSTNFPVLGFTPPQRSRCSPPGLAGGTACVPIHSTIFCGSSSYAKIVLDAPMVISWTASVVTALLGLFGRLGQIVQSGKTLRPERVEELTVCPISAWFAEQSRRTPSRRSVTSPAWCNTPRHPLQAELDRLTLSIEGMSELRRLSVYAVGTTQRGGSTLFTNKWTGLQPTEAGWSPPSDTLCCTRARGS
jgi:hypothetical protein